MSNLEDRVQEMDKDMVGHLELTNKNCDHIMVNRNRIEENLFSIIDIKVSLTKIWVILTAILILLVWVAFMAAS